MTLGHESSQSKNFLGGRGEPFRHLLGWTPDMVAYELYTSDEKGEEDFIGMLPERRKNPEKITKESVLEWGQKVIGDNSDVKDIYFVKVAIQSPIGVVREFGIYYHERMNRSFRRRLCDIELIRQGEQVGDVADGIVWSVSIDP